MATGRPPKRLDHIDGLAGPDESKHRLRVLLETLTGKRSVGSACDELGIGEARLHVLRRQMLEAALGALEPGTAGRPAKLPESEESHRVRELEAKIGDLEVDLEAAHVRTEIALVMPHLLVGDKKNASPASAKRRARNKSRRSGRNDGTSDG